MVLRLYGSYKNLEGIGLEVDVMADLTGGIVVYHKTKSPKEDAESAQTHRAILWKNMYEAITKKYPMTCATAVVRG